MPTTTAPAAVERGDRRGVGRRRVGERRATGGRRHTGDVDVVLDGEGRAGQRQVDAACAAGIDVAGGSEGDVRVDARDPDAGAPVGGDAVEGRRGRVDGGRRRHRPDSPLDAHAARSAPNAACCMAWKAVISSAWAARKARWSARRNVPVLHGDLEPSGTLLGALVEQLGRRHRVEPQLVERPQQPRLLEVRAAPMLVPHLHRAPDELVPAGALHAIDAQVGAADAHGVLRRPGAGRVVLRRHQAMARVERRRHRGAEVDVAQPDDQVRRVEHGPVDVGDVGQPVDAADELDVPRAVLDRSLARGLARLTVPDRSLARLTPRGVGPDAVHVALDRLTRGRVVPRQRKVHDPRRQRHLLDVAEVVLGRREEPVDVVHRASAPVDLDEQRAHAGRDVDDLGHVITHPLLEDVDPHAQRQIEDHRSVLHEEEAVSGAAVGRPRVGAGGVAVAEHGTVAARRTGHRAVPRRAGERLGRAGGAGQPRRAVVVGASRVVGRPRHQADPVARCELAELPPLGGGHDSGAHEAAEARAVRSEDDRHVAGEVDGADRVAGVVDVGRVQAGLATISASPIGARAEQAHPRPGRVEVDPPLGAQQGLEAGDGEEVGGRMGADQHADVPLVGEHRRQAGRQRAHRAGRRRSNGEHVSRGDRPPLVSAEATQRERRAAPEERCDREPAAHGERGAHPRAVHGADADHGAGRDLDRRPGRHGHAVDGRGHGRAADGEGQRGAGAQRRPGRRQLEGGGRLVVADDVVDEAMGEIVHRAGRGHADVPVADPSWQVLHGGQRPAVEHLDGRRRCVEREVGRRLRRRHAGPLTTTLIGVGSNPLQGLLICGQFEIRTSTSISARRST